MENSPITVDLNLARKLIDTQFPQWKDLTLHPVEHQGWDNRTFRLGDQMLVRLPSGAEYERQVTKEHHWLPIIAPKLPLPIPQPIAIGKPSKNYPWDWSIYKWLDGSSANSILLNDSQLETIAKQLANFLIAFHKIDITDGPTAGLHNWWRAAHPSVYDKETQALIQQLKNFIDADSANSLWERARGWALWKALYELSQVSNKSSAKAIEQNRIIEDVLKEHADDTNGAIR